MKEKGGSKKVETKTMDKWLEMVNQKNQAKIFKAVKEHKSLNEIDYIAMERLLKLALSKDKVETFHYNSLDTIVCDTLAELIYKNA